VLKIIGQNQFSVEYRYFNLNIANCAYAIGAICLYNVNYQMTKEPLDRYYYALVAFKIVYLLVSIFTYGLPLQALLMLIGATLDFINLVRLIRIGLKKGIKSLYILNIAILIGLFGVFCQMSAVLFLDYGTSPIGFNEMKYGISPYLIDAIFTLGVIAIPIGLSLFMGIEGNETNKALNKQLMENDLLKNEVIEHEKEKQHLLANQNEILEKQVTERTAELNQSLETLKATQTQLIQSEKLASLGELTAGIAHEIQNPLNFVNNFSEISVDLVNDLKEEIEKPEQDKEYISELFNDLTQNQQKINHHGKRAASIVTGMLQHSQASSDKKEPTDINALADEYLRLSYHGLRAKDSGFNAKIITDFDPTIGKVNVVPQDIGRVLLNLINNAFYAVNERMKHQLPESFKLSGSYEPTVAISTQKIDNQIVIKIKDNGTGIPETVKSKIFQPFFTTKPTGQGTGLGLSLSYDIVTKGHGGALEVDTKEGEGTEFVIHLNLT
jgi:signal transduction histidine kinase